jgi:hypothetical protein
MESEDAGQGMYKGKGLGGKVESGILGALTGSASKGSMFSGMLGIKKGSAGDEALGVLGAAGTGAMSGATIGAAVSGPFAPIGAAIGGVAGGILGAGGELYKVFTDEKSPLKKTLVSAFDTFTSRVKDGAAVVGQGLMSLFGLGGDDSIGQAGMVAGAVPSIYGSKQPPGEVIDKNKPAVMASPIVPGMAGMAAGGAGAIENQLRQDRASVAPGAADTSKDLSKVEKNTAAQLAYLAQMAGQIQHFVSMMSQSSPQLNSTDATVDPGDPRAKVQAKGTASFYPWNQSHSVNMPSRNAIIQS